MTNANDTAHQGSQSVLFGSKKCFIASPIGSSTDSVRERSDLVREFIIDEALSPLGFKTVRADDIEKSGEITTQIVSELIESDLVIADLTGQNANVFYELAVRHSFRKPYIQIVEEGEQLPFDVRAFRTVFVDHQNLKSAAEARETIKQMVHDIEGGADVQSPVTHAVNRQTLEDSKDPSGKELAQIAEVVESIDIRMRRLERHNGNSASRQRLAVSELMKLLDAAISPGKELSTSDFDRLELIATKIQDRELGNFVKHMKMTLPPF